MGVSHGKYGYSLDHEMLNFSGYALHLSRRILFPGEVLIYFSVRGRAAEQGIIFRIPTPGQGIIFVKICSMTGSIFVIFDSERSF